MSEPSEQIVVLHFLLVDHLVDIIEKSGKHEQISKSEMLTHKKGSSFQMLLQILSILIYVLFLILSPTSDEL